MEIAYSSRNFPGAGGNWSHCVGKEQLITTRQIKQSNTNPVGVVHPPVLFRQLVQWVDSIICVWVIVARLSALQIRRIFRSSKSQSLETKLRSSTTCIHLVFSVSMFADND